MKLVSGKNVVLIDWNLSAATHALCYIAICVAMAML